MRARNTHLLTGFLGGVCLTALIYWAPQIERSKKISQEESVLAEMLYDHFQRYSDDCSITKVTQEMHQIEKGAHKKIAKNEYDTTLLDLITKKANKRALSNLFQAEQYLAELVKNPHTLAAVDQKVFIEVLSEGNGDVISPEQTLLLELKQYDISGKLIKNSGSIEPITLSPSKMVKGFQIGIEGAKIGETRKIYIHPSYGYTKIKTGASANNLLIYEVHIKGIK